MLIVGFVFGALIVTLGIMAWKQVNGKGGK